MESVVEKFSKFQQLEFKFFEFVVLLIHRMTLEQKFCAIVFEVENVRILLSIDIKIDIKNVNLCYFHNFTHDHSSITI